MQLALIQSRLYSIAAWTDAIRTVHVDTEATHQSGTASDRSIAKYYIRYMNVLTIIFWGSALVTANLMCITSLLKLSLFNDASAEIKVVSLQIVTNY